jgi:hypothetical protein
MDLCQPRGDLVARVLDEVAAEDAIFSCDVGTPTIQSGHDQGGVQRAR